LYVNEFQSIKRDKMAECKKCGEKTKKGDLFCSKCGTKIEVKKPKPVKKTSTATPPIKEKPELSDDVKRKLKEELEISIKAFKRGDITLEEFQDIKKSIVTKAKAGFYSGKVEEPEPIIEEPPSPLSHTVSEAPLPMSPVEPAPTGDLYRPLRRLDKQLFSRIWYLVPVIFNLIGGLVAYFAIKPVDDQSARKMLAIGVLSFVLVGVGVGYYIYSEDLLPIDKGEKPPTEIIIEGEEGDSEVVELGEVVMVNASNGSAEDMNLMLEDMEEGFSRNDLLSGSLKDPLEFSGGNSSLADALTDKGWLENHRIVLKKEISGGENETIIEKEIDSSISKYNASRTVKSYFDERIAGFEEVLNDGNYTLIDLEINDSGVMGKKVDPDPEFVTRVTYMVFFYKNDVFVSLMVSKVGRGLEEEGVVEYAKIIEGRIS
jgi:uncharacterized Zn finger protein (UPF0148 family)